MVLAEWRDRFGGSRNRLRASSRSLRNSSNALPWTRSTRLGTTLTSAEAFPPKSGRIHRLLNLEFRMASIEGLDDQIVEVLVGHLDAVEQVDVVAAPLAVNRRQATGLFQGRSARAAGADGDCRRSVVPVGGTVAVSGVVRLPLLMMSLHSAFAVLSSGDPRCS